MIRFIFRKGLIFIQLENRWELQRRLVSGKLQFESEVGEIKNLDDSEVHKLWMTGKWALDIDSLGSSADIIGLATPRDLHTFPEIYQKIAERKLHYINKLNLEKLKYNVELWRSLILAASNEINDKSPPSPSTLQEWWRRYRTTKSVMTLLPRYSKGKGPYHSAQYSIFEEVILSVYMTNQKLSKLNVVNNIHYKTELINRARSDEQKIKAPSRATIYRWIDELRQDLVDAARLGAHATRIKYRIAMGGIKLSGLLERVEMDHTSLDLIVYSKKYNTSYGRPWITFAIDVFSKTITGFYISFRAPSSHAVLQCLKMSILPKDLILERYPKIKSSWAAHGIPHLVALDNGMDFHGNAVNKSCMELGIQMVFCPTAEAYFKGSIERYFRTQNEGLINKLPGTTFSNIFDRGDYLSESEAAIEFDDLVYLVTKWIVDVYQHEHHRGINTSPFRKWMDCAPNTIFELPASPTSLNVITGIPAQRTLFHYGIELEGLHYNSLFLQELRRHSGENMKVDLKYFMDTVEYIEVYDERTREYFKVNAVNLEYCEGLQREMHQLIREHSRKKYNDNFSSTHLMEAKLEIADHIKALERDKKMRMRKKAASISMLDSTSVFNDQSPTSGINKVKKVSAPKAPTPLPDGLNDQIPHFDFTTLPNLNLSEDESEGSAS